MFFLDIGIKLKQKQQKKTVLASNFSINLAREQKPSIVFNCLFLHKCYSTP